MDLGDREDAPARWRASDEQPHGVRQWWVLAVVFGLPVVAGLVGGLGHSAWGLAMIGVFVVAAVVVGTVDTWQGHRRAVSITMDGPDDFVVRQVNGQEARYPFAAVTRVRVTRDAGGDTLWMRISVRDQVVRTRSGPEVAASTFLAVCAEAGATVTYRTETSD